VGVEILFDIVRNLMGILLGIDLDYFDIGAIDGEFYIKFTLCHKCDCFVVFNNSLWPGPE
jgi:hypothetical protein